MKYSLLTKRSVAEMGAILGLSLALGALFNASNPLGIRWSVGAQSAATVGTTTSPPAITPAVNPSLAAPLTASTPRDFEHVPSSHDFPPITWKQVKPMLAANEVVLVDARPKSTHESYSIPGSISLPFNTTADEFTAFRNAHTADSHVVVYCASATCLASKMLADKLVQYGFQRIHIMEEGYFGWLRAEKGQDTVAISSHSDQKAPAQNASGQSGPIRDSVEPGTGLSDTNQALGSQLSRLNVDPPMISWVETKRLINSGEVVLVDVRPASSFAAGHIPGAISFPESRFAQDIETFQRRFSTNSVLVLYCSSSTCSKAKQVAEKLMREYNYRSVYDMNGGYEEWQQWEVSSKTVKSQS